MRHGVIDPDHSTEIEVDCMVGAPTLPSSYLAVTTPATAAASGLEAEAYGQKRGGQGRGELPVWC